MTEIFDIITAINRLANRVDDLDSRLGFLCNYPTLIAFNDYVEEEVACKLLHISPRKLLRMRCANEITFTHVHRKILYPVQGITKYLTDHENRPNPPVV